MKTKPLTATQLEAAVRPQVDAFVRELARMQAAAMAEMLARALDAARASFEQALAPSSSPAPKPARRPAKAAGHKPRVKQRREKPATIAPGPAPKQAPAGRPRCGKCGQSGHNARTCGRVPTADAEEEPARVRRTRASEPAPEERVIPHVALVRMLAADRAENAVGDAGGFVARADREPRLVGPATGTREVCRVHGWVGRHAFERDNHAACDPVGEPCSHCGGSKFMQTSYTICDHCDGTGVEPARAPGMSEAESRDVGSEADSDSAPRRSRSRASLGMGARPTTIAPKRITRAILRDGAAGFEAELAELDALRPKTRAECIDGPRPCPWVSCKHHLAIDVNPETGSIKLNFPDREPWDLEHTCALDVAEQGEHTLEQVGAVLNVTRERLRQIEVAALHLLKQEPIVAEAGNAIDCKEVA